MNKYATSSQETFRISNKTRTKSLEKRAEEFTVYIAVSYIALL